MACLVYVEIITFQEGLTAYALPNLQGQAMVSERCQEADVSAKQKAVFQQRSEPF